MNLRKKTFLILSCFIVVVCFTSCSTQIPFNKLILNEDIEKDIVIDSIDLNKQNISLKDVDTIKLLSNGIFDVIGNKDYYYKNYNNPKDFLHSIKKYLDEDLYDQIIQNNIKNDFKKIIDDIYYKDNMYYNSSNIIEVGINNKNERFAVIEIISVNDTKDFMISTIKLYLNKNYIITKTEILSEDNMLQNTTKSLSEDSLIPNDLLQEKTTITDFFKKIKNKELYEVVLKNENEASIQLDALINNIEIESKSDEDLKSLFKIGKGTFENYSIKEYVINDKEGLAISKFILTFINGAKTDDFTVVYSRITNQIFSIRKN